MEPTHQLAFKLGSAEKVSRYVYAILNSPFGVGQGGPGMVSFGAPDLHQAAWVSEGLAVLIPGTCSFWLGCRETAPETV